MHFKKLTIVSDTSIYFDNGKFYAFGPVVREIEFIEEFFDKIVWIGFNDFDKKNDLSMQKIASKKIEVILLKKVGGKGILSNIKILLHYPSIFFIILKNILNADIVHTRAPSHPALIAFFISFFYKNKIWWNKYAGNWDQKNDSNSYQFQKWVLNKIYFSKVTINGFWENQPKHCLSFENPCLTEMDIQKGTLIANKKQFETPFNFIFIGRLDEKKGVDKIIEALRAISFDKIGSVNFIGNGEKLDHYKIETAFLKNKINFHGFLDKNTIFKILETTHFLLLPSQSEGFPKVIAEAACFGVVPIVSNVGAISHYINETNGFLWDLNSKENYTTIVSKAIYTNGLVLKEKSNKIQEVAQKFTFIFYLEKLKRLVFIS